MLTELTILRKRCRVLDVCWNFRHLLETWHLRDISHGALWPFWVGHRLVQDGVGEPLIGLFQFDLRLQLLDLALFLSEQLDVVSRRNVGGWLVLRCFNCWVNLPIRTGYRRSFRLHNSHPLRPHPSLLCLTWCRTHRRKSLQWRIRTFWHLKQVITLRNKFKCLLLEVIRDVFVETLVVFKFF